jgi:hypothetical protein
MSDQLPNKLSAFAADPPPGLWEKIEASLQEQAEFGRLPQRLYAFEATPPSDIWTIVRQELDRAQAVPFFQRFRRPLRYGSIAAAFILVAVTVSLLLVSKKTISEGNAGALLTTKERIVTTEVARPTQAPKDPYHNDPPDERNPATVSRTQRFWHLLKRAPLSVSAAIPSTSDLPLPAEAPPRQIVAEDASSEAYLIYSDGDGHAMKLPKKLFDVFHCGQQDETCKMRLRNLQQKIATSAFSNDFTGVLELLQHLNEPH